MSRQPSRVRVPGAAPATVQTIAIPLMPFDSWQVYVPNWAEWATSGMIVAYGFLVMSLSYRYLPVFPQEKMLNK